MENFEFRCFIHHNKLRAISSEFNIENLVEIINMVDNITHICEYEDYCIDFTYHLNKLMIIEINTPVWLFTCSGLFCLDEVFDVEILVGEYIPDIINYPILKILNDEN